MATLYTEAVTKLTYWDFTKEEASKFCDYLLLCGIHQFPEWDIDSSNTSVLEMKLGITQYSSIVRWTTERSGLTELVEEWNQLIWNQLPEKI